jgi:hypothetical protein
VTHVLGLGPRPDYGPLKGAAAKIWPPGIPWVAAIRDLPACDPVDAAERIAAHRRKIDSLHEASSSMRKGHVRHSQSQNGSKTNSRTRAHRYHHHDSLIRWRERDERDTRFATATANEQRRTGRGFSLQ